MVPNEITGLGSLAGLGVFTAVLPPPVGAGYTIGADTMVVYKISFSDDSISNLASTLSVLRDGVAAMSNSGVAGYFALGTQRVSPFGFLGTVDKFAFSNDSRSTLGSGLSTLRYRASGMANSGTAGYICGGNNVVNGKVNTVNKIIFSNDSSSALGTGLSQTKTSASGFANSGTAGYIAGGDVTTTGATNTIDKFAFSDDSRTSLSPGLNSARKMPQAFANSGVAGYVSGGISNAENHTAESNKYVFSSDTRTVVGSALSAGRSFGQGFAKSGTAGYISGGITSSGSTATVLKMPFSTESFSTIAASLGGISQNSGAFANSGTL